MISNSVQGYEGEGCDELQWVFLVLLISIVTTPSVSRQTEVQGPVTSWVTLWTRSLSSLKVGALSLDIKFCYTRTHDGYDF